MERLLRGVESRSRRESSDERVEERKTEERLEYVYGVVLWCIVAVVERK